MIKPIFSLSLASCALALASPAMAQKNLSEADATALALYAMPLALDGVQSACGDYLAADAYIITNAEALSSRYSAAAEGSFDRARRAMLSMGEVGSGEMPAEMMEGMSEAELSPFLGAMIREMVASEIDGDTCAQVDHMLELLDPLPPENLAGVIGFILVESQSDDEDE